PNPGWEQYIRNTGARFKCIMCGRSWSSNRVMVVFHMRLLNGQGIVKVRRFRQNCKNEQFEINKRSAVRQLDIIMTNVFYKIRIKCYHEDLGRRNKTFIRHDVSSPHEPAQGICTRS
uniref:3CxxC-type domain-containing protein n=1 Tax=Dicentrarchus labrax TaxID=13489 RepID=A0A8C4DX33_DICLA